MADATVADGVELKRVDVAGTATEAAAGIVATGELKLSDVGKKTARGWSTSSNFSKAPLHSFKIFSSSVTTF